MTHRTDRARATGRRAGLVAMLAMAAVAVACSTWFSDPATWLADDIIDNARALRQSRETERTFVHQAASSPNACAQSYRVTLSGVGNAAAIGIGCDGRAAGVFTWTTNRIARVVSVPSELEIAKQAGETFRVTLRKNGGAIEVVRVD